MKRFWQYHKASARTNLPSASVFKTSMVWPDIEVTISPGLTAFPEGMFSTKPTTPTALTLAFLPASAFIKPITTPDPPISYFISSIPFEGLIDMPPVSKVTPLPTNATGLFPFPFFEPYHFITTSFDGFSLPWPTQSKEPIPNFFILVSSSTSTFTPNLDNFFASLAKVVG